MKNVSHLVWSLVALCGFGSCPAGQAATGEWRSISGGFEEVRVSAVVAAPGHATLLYAASGSTVYVSRDGGVEWQASFHAPAQVKVTDVALDPADPQRLLAATEQGLYGSFDGGTTWSLLFRGTAEGEAHGTVMAFHPARPGMALLGTRGGLFVSEDGGQHWSEVGVPQAAREVMAVAWDPSTADRLYLVAASGVFTGSLSTGQWQQRFSVVHAPEETDETNSEAEDVEEREEAGERLMAAALDPREPSNVYVASSRGVYQSRDTGASWQRLAQTGLLSTDVSRLVVAANSPVQVYAGTAHGVARYEPSTERWQMITEGLATTRVNDLAATATALWVATDQGLYRSDVAETQASATDPPASPDAQTVFAHEPTIGHVQDVAVRYAEVHPDKISAWRTQARLRALVPTFSAGFSNNVTDKWDWETGSGTVAYDNHLLRGKEALEWNMNLAWDLGDMIYSTDQTSIDVRSKLMVQLRDDIVDEVTRTYFERRRTQLALLTAPPKDPQKRWETELRVQELTALIDGLTGGWFSRELERRSHEHAP